jgi:hypothetical protein
MSTKSLGYKSKWLMIGLVSGIFVTLFIPKIWIKNRFKNEQDTDYFNSVNRYKFPEYSQWPPFLTDATFDLV